MTRRAQPDRPPGPVYFPDLDGWRFVAFLLVFLHHSLGPIADQLDWGPAFEFAAAPVRKLARAGDVGVAFFFVLSGFLITYLILWEVQQNGRLNLWRFYLRRTLRIWPLYYAVVAFALVAYPALRRAAGLPDAVGVGERWCYWAFLGNFDLIRHGMGPGALMTIVTWSVAIEEQFYLVWPLCFLAIRPRWVGLLFPAAVVQSLVFRARHLDQDPVLYFHSLSVIGDLALGGGLAYLVLRRPAFLGFVRTLPRWSIAAAYAAGVLMLAYLDVWSAWPPLKVFSRLICGLFFGFIVLEQNFAIRSPVKMSSFAWPTRWGRYTYGLYLLHPVALTFCLTACRALRLDYLWPPVTVATGVVAFGLTLGIAFVSYWWFEHPFLRLKDRYKEGDRSAEGAAVIDTAAAVKPQQSGPCRDQQYPTDPAPPGRPNGIARGRTWLSKPS